MNSGKYPFIPEYRYTILQKANSHILLEKANEYYKIYLHMQKLEQKLKDIKRLCIKKEKEYLSSCPHSFEAQPREYQSSREWICTTCGLVI